MKIFVYDDTKEDHSTVLFLKRGTNIQVRELEAAFGKDVKTVLFDSDTPSEDAITVILR